MASTLSKDEVEEIREAFDAFDFDKNGHITSKEIGETMKSLGEDIPGYRLRDIIAEVDTNKNGTVEFDEFLQMYMKVSTKAKSSAFKELIKKREKVNVKGGASEASAEGTKHSYSDGEKAAFADWINSVLGNDPDCASYLPIDVQGDSDELFEKLKDGIMLCKMINQSVEKTIDERTINKKGLNAFKIHENQILVVNSANAIGCSVVNIGAEDLSKGKAHLLLGLLWQIIRIGLFANLSLASNPNIAALLLEGETLEDLMKLSPEELLLRWVNHHLEKAGTQKRINNFSSDIKDSEAYAILLHRIAPDHMIDRPETIMGVASLQKRAEIFLGNADKIKCRKFLRAKDIVDGNPKLNMAFVANLFNTYPALELGELEEEIEPYEETREEKTFRNWMNSMGVNPFVNHLYNDLGSGMILFQLYDAIKPGTVNWDRVNKPPFKALIGGNMKKIENCNYAVELGKNMGFSLVGIGGEDIRNGVKTLVLALTWQLMRAYTLSLLQKLSESDKAVTDNMIIEWVNNMLQSAEKSSKISSMKDSSISTSVPVIDLIDAIKPGSIDYSLVLEAASEEEKCLNATYAISMARKIGARVYALAEDLVEVKPKMVLTVLACLMTRGLSKNI